MHLTKKALQGSNNSTGRSDRPPLPFRAGRAGETYRKHFSTPALVCGQVPGDLARERVPDPQMPRRERDERMQSFRTGRALAQAQPTHIWDYIGGLLSIHVERVRRGGGHE